MPPFTAVASQSPSQGTLKFYTSCQASKLDFYHQNKLLFVDFHKLNEHSKTILYMHPNVFFNSKKKRKKETSTNSSFYHLQVQILKRNLKEEQKSVLSFSKSPAHDNVLSPLLPVFGIEIQEAFLKHVKSWERGHFQLGFCPTVQLSKLNSQITKYTSKV